MLWRAATTNSRHVQDRRGCKRSLISRAATAEHAMQPIEGQAGGKWPIRDPCTPSDLHFLPRFGKLGLGSARHGCLDRVAPRGWGEPRGRGDGQGGSHHLCQRVRWARHRRPDVHRRVRHAHVQGRHQLHRLLRDHQRHRRRQHLQPERHRLSLADGPVHRTRRRPGRADPRSGYGRGLHRHR